jgi:hypothetical protein
VAAVVALAAWAIVGAVGGGTPAAAPTSTAPELNLPGRLLVLDTSTGRLGAARPNGSGFAPFAGPAFPASNAVASADGRHVVVGNTQVVDLDAQQGVQVRPTPLSNGNDFAGLQPFADHDTRVVLLSAPPSTPGGVWTVDLDGGSRHSLGGDAWAAVGDPVRDGTIVAVQGGTEVNLGDYTERDTSRVELRSWQHRTTVLATTRQLLDDANLPSDRPYTVWPVVSPDGRFVALAVDELTANPNSVTAKHALVVTDRTGKTLMTRTSFTGIHPVWSAGSSELAYVDDQGVVLLDVAAGRVSSRSVSAQALGVTCLFSPAGDYLLCDDPQSGDRGIVRLADGRVDQVHYDSTQLAIAWLSSVPPTSSATAASSGTLSGGGT